MGISLDSAGIVIVGGGLAGLRSAEALRSSGYTGAITIVGDEPRLPYDRPSLSKGVLVGHGDIPELRRRPAVNDVTWRLGAPVVASDLAAGLLRLADGSEIEFDGLVIASGIRPRRLPIPGPQGGRHVLRSADDALSLRAELAAGADVVVLGAGFVGCEVAASARQRGAGVTVVALDGEPLLRPLGAELGAALRRRHEARGVHFRLGCTVDSLDGDGASGGDDRIATVRLSDGTDLPASVVRRGRRIGAQHRVARRQRTGPHRRDRRRLRHAGLRPCAGRRAAGGGGRRHRPHPVGRLGRDGPDGSSTGAWRAIPRAEPAGRWPTWSPAGSLTARHSAGCRRSGPTSTSIRCRHSACPSGPPGPRWYPEMSTALRRRVPPRRRARRRRGHRPYGRRGRLPRPDRRAGMSPLTLGSQRGPALAHAAGLVARAWAEFDEARAVETAAFAGLLERLREALPEQPGDVLGEPRPGRRRARCVHRAVPSAVPRVHRLQRPRGRRPRGSPRPLLRHQPRPRRRRGHPPRTAGDRVAGRLPRLPGDGRLLHQRRHHQQHHGARGGPRARAARESIHRDGRPLRGALLLGGGALLRDPGGRTAGRRTGQRAGDRHRRAPAHVAAPPRRAGRRRPRGGDRADRRRGDRGHDPDRGRRPHRAPSPTCARSAGCGCTSTAPTACRRRPPRAPPVSSPASTASTP